jgi:hypothetical protein
MMTWLELYCEQDKQSWALIFKKSKDYLSSHQIKYHEVKEGAALLFSC